MLYLLIQTGKLNHASGGAMHWGTCTGTTWTTYLEMEIDDKSRSN
jgi:hypothetical protein